MLMPRHAWLLYLDKVRAKLGHLCTSYLTGLLLMSLKIFNDIRYLILSIMTVLVG